MATPDPTYWGFFLFGGATGKTVRKKLKNEGVWLDRILGIIMVFAAGYFFYMAMT